MPLKGVPQQAVKEEADLQDLKLVLSESLSRIESIYHETRSETGGLLNSNTDRKAFNRSLLESMAKQIDTWEKTKPFDLRISQLRGIHKLIAFLERGGNEHNTGYFNQPTGAGKTVLFSLIAFLMNRKTVIFVPKNVLLDQTKQEMISLGIPEESIGIIGEGKNELGKQFQIITYQSHNQKMGSNDEYTSDMQSREVVICDEAHRSLGKVTQSKRKEIAGANDASLTSTEDMTITDEGTELTDQEISDETEFFDRKEEFLQSKRNNVLTLGFTATPEMGNKSVHNYFHELIATESYKELVDAGILVPFEIVSTTDSHIYEDELDYIAEKDEGEILRREGVYDKAHIALNKLKKDSKEPIFPVAFCSTHDECLECQKNAKKHGLRCSIVTSYEDKDALGKAERDLLAGDIDEIATVDKLTEGWNLRPLNCAMILRASQSPARIVQGAGRTSRSFSGSTYVRPPNTYTLHTPLDKKKSFIIEPKWVRMTRDQSNSEEERKKKKKSHDENDAQSTDHADHEDDKKEAGSGNCDVSSGRSPLTFAQAMALSGQDPSGFITSQDGIEIAFTTEISTDKLYNGKQIWTILELMTAHPKTYSVALFAKMREQNLQAIPHLTCKKRNVYYREELETLLPCEKDGANGTATSRGNNMNTGQSKKEKTHQGKPVLTLREFCNLKNIKTKIMREKIKKSGLKKVRDGKTGEHFFVEDLEKMYESLDATEKTPIEVDEETLSTEKPIRANQAGEAIIALSDGTSMTVYTTRRALQELGICLGNIKTLKSIGLNPLAITLATHEGNKTNAYLPADVEQWKAAQSEKDSRAVEAEKIYTQDTLGGPIEMHDKSGITKKLWLTQGFEETYGIKPGFINEVSKYISIPKINVKIKYKNLATHNSDVYEEEDLQSLLPLTIRQGIGVMLPDNRSNSLDTKRCAMTFRAYFDRYIADESGDMSYSVFGARIIGKIAPIRLDDLLLAGDIHEEVSSKIKRGRIIKITNTNKVISYFFEGKDGNIEIMGDGVGSSNDRLYWADDITEIMKPTAS